MVVKKQRAWKLTPEWGANVLKCWEAEWPGVRFEFLIGDLYDLRLRQFVIN
ncbi:unnamed protein product [Gemmata massiliana]|uniref:Uncharacterized protein n=1 Tax=Gemmata massiliana TaxID=1210884 RepID=A0A6P2DGA1_9BACT|nr:hypothetical protein [Gemmata massiliana]VTR98823.1 unnamed protein product [Gemmata massiliana]